MHSATAPAQRSTRGFRIATGSLALAFLAILAWGLMHVSAAPALLGRYSVGYAFLLAAVATIVGTLAYAALWPQPVLREYLGNAGLLAGTLIVSLLMVEWGLRLFNPWGVEFFHHLPYHMQGMVDHPTLGYAHPRSVSYFLGKNLVSLNSHGLRDDEFPVAKPAGERRLLVLGDSVTFGWGVDQAESFSHRMERILRQRSDRPWQVINAGVNGYNTTQQAAWFKEYGAAFQPDIVLLFYVSNDVEQAVDPNVTTWRRYPSWPGSLPELLDRVRSLSYTVQLWKLMNRARELQAAREASDSAAEPSVTLHSGWPRSRRALAEIASLCRAASIPFLVAREGAADTAFRQQLGELGMEVIGAGGLASAVPVEKRYVSRVDPHPSALAHELMASHFVGELERRGLLR